VQVVGEPAEQIGGVEVEAGQLAGWDAEQRTGAERAELQLDPRLRAVVRDDGGGRVQAADEGAVGGGRLGRVGLLRHEQWLVERDDQGQERGR
jgi:hypothetical protein